MGRQGAAEEVAPSNRGRGNGGRLSPPAGVFSFPRKAGAGPFDKLRASCRRSQGAGDELLPYGSLV